MKTQVSASCSLVEKAVHHKLFVTSGHIMFFFCFSFSMDVNYFSLICFLLLTFLTASNKLEFQLLFEEELFDFVINLDGHPCRRINTSSCKNEKLC